MRMTAVLSFIFLPSLDGMKSHNKIANSQKNLRKMSNLNWNNVPRSFHSVYISVYTYGKIYDLLCTKESKEIQQKINNQKK